MITTGRYNFTVQNGEQFVRQLKLMEYNNQPFNLTDYTIKSWIKSHPTDTTPVTEFTASKLVPTEGVFALELPPSSSMLLTSSCYYYDIRISSGSDVVIYPLEGKILASPSITKY
jgi:hypothetical protein